VDEEAKRKFNGKFYLNKRQRTEAESEQNLLTTVSGAIEGESRAYNEVMALIKREVESGSQENVQRVYDLLIGVAEEKKERASPDVLYDLVNLLSQHDQRMLLKSQLSLLRQVLHNNPDHYKALLTLTTIHKNDNPLWALFYCARAKIVIGDSLLERELKFIEQMRSFFSQKFAFLKYEDTGNYLGHLEAFIKTLDPIRNCCKFRQIFNMIKRINGNPLAQNLLEQSQTAHKQAKAEENRLQTGDRKRLALEYQQIFCEFQLLGNNALIHTYQTLYEIYNPTDPMNDSYLPNIEGEGSNLQTSIINEMCI